MATLGFLGIRLDPSATRSGAASASSPPTTPPVTVLVVPTNEELEIARQTSRSRRPSDASDGVPIHARTHPATTLAQ
jgi:acetate kinase